MKRLGVASSPLPPPQTTWGLGRQGELNCPPQNLEQLWQVSATLLSAGSTLTWTHWSSADRMISTNKVWVSLFLSCDSRKCPLQLLPPLKCSESNPFFWSKISQWLLKFIRLWVTFNIFHKWFCYSPRLFFPYCFSSQTKEFNEVTVMEGVHTIFISGNRIVMLVLGSSSCRSLGWGRRKHPNGQELEARALCCKASFPLLVWRSSRGLGWQPFPELAPKNVWQKEMIYNERGHYSG